MTLFHTILLLNNSVEEQYGIREKAMDIGADFLLEVLKAIANEADFKEHYKDIFSNNLINKAQESVLMTASKS